MGSCLRNSIFVIISYDFYYVVLFNRYWVVSFLLRCMIQNVS